MLLIFKQNRKYLYFRHPQLLPQNEPQQRKAEKHYESLRGFETEASQPEQDSDWVLSKQRHRPRRLLSDCTSDRLRLLAVNCIANSHAAVKSEFCTISYRRLQQWPRRFTSIASNSAPETCRQSSMRRATHRELCSTSDDPLLKTHGLRDLTESAALSISVSSCEEAHASTRERPTGR